ncbi:hypothetical protein [Parazoarcus communis]|jgi:hypothetical protein|uniref:Uncharacterized protein n=1 Tax=Parazoarcus communis SWub3 = DSM 12120 TaxID=1121029 RepID=A0A323V194_9RHOO|nr:hypothetical protein [Parazoarcus communis]NMG70118.1 hypothetical protein [Parazoarcus communis SWub3 = DSM 12120]PZA18291.1 hypothetical protein DNK49_01810 [Azoarcus communis] [Parazoarcus communis SWub3 = DSM 12120]
MPTPAQLVSGLALLALATKLYPAPAPWYWWHSRIDGQGHCAQISPGPGWIRGAGPFRDLRCTQAADARRQTSPPAIDPGQPEVRSISKKPIQSLD